jgi:hypothetical protein
MEEKILSQIKKEEVDVCLQLIVYLMQQSLQQREIQ